MSWQTAVETTVTGLWYELVDLERSGAGLLRVSIDRVAGHAYAEGLGSGEYVTVEDCETVTRQLQYVLEVENLDYARLEVSSPGLDRPLKRPADYERFAGEAIDVTLKLPFKGRKKYRGLLAPRDGGWRLLLDDNAGAPAAKSGGKNKGKPNAKRKSQAAQAEGMEDESTRALDFALEEVREARLVPVVNFKGRPAALPAQLEAQGGHKE
jgi:ribosome maturation factor RimP